MRWAFWRNSRNTKTEVPPASIGRTKVGKQSAPLSGGDHAAAFSICGMSYGDRTIVMGSTPVDESTSRILRAYEASDRRAFECACSECGDLSELAWSMIEWKPGEPEAAVFRRAHFEALLPARFKPEMVAKGGWRATNWTKPCSSRHGRQSASTGCLPKPST